MDKYLCFINFIGQEADGKNRYEFIFTDSIKDFNLIEENDICCMTDGISLPNYKYVYILKTDIKLDLIQDNCCFTFKHSKLGICSLAWQSLEGLDEYPQDGRIFFKFGETYEEVEEKLAIKNILMIEKND